MDKRKLRISDKERNIYMDTLTSNFSEGRLDVNEFDSRSQQLIQSKTHGEVEHLFDDLLPVATADEEIEKKENLDEEDIGAETAAKVIVWIIIALIAIFATVVIVRLIPYLIAILFFIAIVSIFARRK